MLRERLTPEADTLQQLLINHDLQRRIKGRVIIVDEAGLVSTRQNARFMPDGPSER